MESNGICTPEIGEKIDKIFKVFVSLSSTKIIRQETFDEACNRMLTGSSETDPIKFKLLPLNDTAPTQWYYFLDESISQRILTLFTKILKHRTLLSYLSKARGGTKYSNLCGIIGVDVGKAVEDIMKTRKRIIDMDELHTVMESYEKRLQKSEEVLHGDLLSANEVYRSSLLREYFETKNFKLISYHKFTSKRTSNEAFVLFTDVDTINMDEDENVALLKRLGNNTNEENEFFIVDNKDVGRKRRQQLRNKCHSFIKGKVCRYDLLGTIGKDLDKSIINGPKDILSKHPIASALAVLQCPSKNCYNDLIESWICSFCSVNPIRYSLELQCFFCLVCKIKIPEDKALYRCSQVSHGINFEKGSSETKIEVRNLQETEEKSILILGETGVGKSTWINGLRNYLEFEDLDDAVKNGGPIALIPAQFTYTDQYGESYVISVGDSDETNERNEVGRSNTQQPQSYTFTRSNGQIINLIDTPGLCDTDNIDEENFKNILIHIKRYERIHAICILLKPNNARLTVIFRYCINELLTHFHKGAVENILFCFTNSRSTFYCPGDTLPPLQRLLTEHDLHLLDTKEDRKEKIYCFDNEAFRFLAILKNGIEMSTDQFKDYSNSWNCSVKETDRLFNKILSLQGHETKQTIDINQARDIILTMAKPLAEITRAINKSIDTVKEAEDQSIFIDGTAKDLENKLHFQGIDLVRKNLSRPRTVCTDEACIERKLAGLNQEQVIVYSQHCHPECYLKGISPEVINDIRLAECLAIISSTGICHQCHHHYRQHMHITYELEEVVKSFMSEDVKNEIAKKETQKEKYDELIRQKNVLVDELTKEHDKVIDSSAKFGCFLKENAILCYNDAVEDYLQHLLDEEKKKDPHLQSKKQISKIEKTKEAYINKRQMLDVALKNNAVIDGINFSDPNIVLNLQKELYSLKHYGSTLKNVIEKGQLCLLENAKFKRVIVSSRPKPKKKRDNLFSVFQYGFSIVRSMVPQSFGNFFNYRMTNVNISTVQSSYMGPFQPDGMQSIDFNTQGYNNYHVSHPNNYSMARENSYCYQSPRSIGRGKQRK